MLKDLTTIFKKRWPEMLLIVGFMAIGLFLYMQLIAATPSAKTPSPIIMTETTSLLYSTASMVFFVLFLTIYLGFLATLSVNYDTPHDPSILIKIGRIFFWRNFRFHILFEIYCISIALLILSPMKLLFFRTTNIDDMPQWLLHICMIIAIAIFSKPLLLVPPIMIYKNLMILPAIKVMANYPISKIKILPALLIGGFLFVGSILEMLNVIKPNTVILSITFAACSIIMATIMLLTGIIGIWFVAGKRFGAMQEIPEETTEPEEEA